MKKIFYLVALLLLTACSTETVVNLVPEEPSNNPSYWCTWGAQNYAIDSTTLKNATWGLDGHSRQANNLTEQAVFGENGWADILPEVRKDLILMFDLGWDIGRDIDFDKKRWLLGSLELAEDKSPSWTGSPMERLKKLNQLCIEKGWKGAGIWVAAHPVNYNEKELSRTEIEDYYRERFKWSHEAGITYWKVDYGVHNGKDWYREMLTRLAEEHAPGLWVENCRNGSPLNDYECPWDTKVYHESGEYKQWGNGNVLKKAVEVIGYSHVFRTYDVTAHLSIPTTLDRVAQQLKVSSQKGANDCVINCEDEMYMGATLGCAVGIMRHPHWLHLEGNNYNPFRVDKRMTEVTRAIKWQRIAPPFGVGAKEVVLSSNMLADNWTFKEGDTWAYWVINRNIVQKAPGIVVRGIGLPTVECEGEPPFVLASRHPNGAVAIATLPRIDSLRGYYFPHADITLHIEKSDTLIGVFGKYASLKLASEDLSMKCRIFAQDLAGKVATDITGNVKFKKGSILIPGQLIEEIGCSANKGEDLSEPGLVLKLEYSTK